MLSLSEVSSVFILLQVQKKIFWIKAGAGGHRTMEEDEGEGEEGGGEGKVGFIMKIFKKLRQCYICI
mgnify:CR=1 FL=1